jgi:hypothetical protein
MNVSEQYSYKANKPRMSPKIVAHSFFNINILASFCLLQYTVGSGTFCPDVIGKILAVRNKVLVPDRRQIRSF